MADDISPEQLPTNSMVGRSEVVEANPPASDSAHQRSHAAKLLARGYQVTDGANPYAVIVDGAGEIRGRIK